MAQKIGFINLLSWYKGKKGHWKKNHCDWISSVTVANLLFTILMTGNFCFNAQPTQNHSVFSFIHYSARHMSRILQNSPFATAVIKFQIWNTFLTVPFEFQLKKKKQRKNTDSERLLKNKETLIFIYDPSAANSEWNTMTVTWTCLESLRNHHVCQQGDKSTTTRTTKRDKQKQTKTNNYKQVTDVLLRWSWRT